MKRSTWLNILHFLLIATVLILPFIAWSEALNWKAANIEPLTIFPLLGLWAFSLMWTHYLLNTCKCYWPDASFRKWHELTTAAVLVLILLHPAIIIFQSFSKDFGLIDFVGENNTIWLLYGFLAFIGFMLWEMVLRFKNLSIVKNYKPLWEAINNAAFIAIFFHGLYLGSHLQSGWLRYVWIFYGITGLLFIFHSYFKMFRSENEATEKTD